MKQYIYAIFAAVILTSCNDEVLNKQSSGITFSVDDFVANEGTRVSVDINSTGASFSWTDGDTLGVFPANGYPTAFPISGGAGSNTAVFDGGDWALRQNASYISYYPFSIKYLDRTKLPLSYKGQMQNGNASTSNIGKYDYLSSAVTNVSNSGNADFQMKHLGCLYRIVATMPASDIYNKLIIKTSGSFAVKSTYDLSNNSALNTIESSKVIELGLSNISTSAFGDKITLYLMLPPADYSKDTLSFFLFGENNNTYTKYIIGKNMEAGKSYSSSISFANIETNGHDYVDLGLPSGNLWATCNVGANNIYDYGDYFSQGETTTKSNFVISSYKHTDSNGNWEKYGTADNIYTLNPDDDVVSVKWGGDWRMATKDEAKELIDNCTYSVEYINGVKGMNFVGPNGNSLFIPSSGMYTGYNNYEKTSNGGFWTSSIGYCLSTATNSSYERCSIVDYECGYYGMSVRGIISPNLVKQKTYTINGVEYPMPQAVDLGITINGKKLYFADRNLGSINKEDAGLYFAWGETEPKQNYSYSTYKYCNGTWDTPTKYINNSNYGKVDNKTELDSEDDAAHVKIGNGWRIPTVSEINILKEKCSFEYCKFIGVDGYKVSGSNNSCDIFIPICGLIDGYNLSMTSYGFYQTSTACYSGPNRCYVFHLTKDKFQSAFDTYRRYGYNIRPVKLE